MSNSEQEKTGGVFFESLKLVAKTVINAQFLLGVLIGGVVGWGLCWAIFVLPFHKNLAEREAQLENWSKLNQQLQQITMDNRTLSQTELKQFVAANQEAAASFAEVQRRLHERELRLTETPTSFILIPLCVVALAIGGMVAFFKALNQRAMATVEHVLHLAPREMVQEVVERHVLFSGPRPQALLTDKSGGSTGTAVPPD